MRKSLIDQGRGREEDEDMTNTYFRSVTTAYALMYLAARTEYLCKRQMRKAV